MKAWLIQGNAVVEWDDEAGPITVRIGDILASADDKLLRDLYACLGFLFSKPGP